MGLNPQTEDDTQRWLMEEYIALEGAVVIRVPTHTQGDSVGHAVEVLPDTRDESMVADVRVDQIGDVCLPSTQDHVVIGYRLNGRPHVLGSRYSEDDTIPDFEEGERVIGHPASNSHVRFQTDGTIQLVGDGGATVELQPDGDIVCNDGNTAPVTDVDFTNETVTRASDIFVPSN